MDPTTRPIFHLSLPVRDLKEAIDFYRSTLGAEIGRHNEAFVDVLLFGAQITLHHDPDNVTQLMPRTRHFGWTLPWDDWDALAATITAVPSLVEPPTVSHPGEPREQAKMMLSDPSGNLVELKAYRRPEHVLGPKGGRS